MASTAPRLGRVVYPLGVLALISLAPSLARADFFDGARRTFQTDIPHFFQKDVPHFFQDDIPCAFGGKPTSGTKRSCKSASHPAKPAPRARGRDAAIPKEKPKPPDAPPFDSAK